MNGERVDTVKPVRLVAEKQYAVGQAEIVLAQVIEQPLAGAFRLTMQSGQLGGVGVGIHLAPLGVAVGTQQDRAVGGVEVDVCPPRTPAIVGLVLADRGQVEAADVDTAASRDAPFAVRDREVHEIVLSTGAGKIGILPDQHGVLRNGDRPAEEGALLLGIHLEVFISGIVFLLLRVPYRPARVLVILHLHRLEQRAAPIGGHGDPLTLPASELQQNEPFPQPLFGLYRNRIILGRRDVCCAKITSHTQPLYLHNGGILHPLRVGKWSGGTLTLGRGGRVHTGIRQLSRQERRRYPYGQQSHTSGDQKHSSEAVACSVYAPAGEFLPFLQDLLIDAVIQKPHDLVFLFMLHTVIPSFSSCMRSSSRIAASSLLTVDSLTFSIPAILRMGSPQP